MQPTQSAISLCLNMSPIATDTAAYQQLFNEIHQCSTEVAVLKKTALVVYTAFQRHLNAESVQRVELTLPSNEEIKQTMQQLLKLEKAFIDLQQRAEEMDCSYPTAGDFDEPTIHELSIELATGELGELEDIKKKCYEFGNAYVTSTFISLLTSTTGDEELQQLTPVINRIKSFVAAMDLPLSGEGQIVLQTVQYEPATWHLLSETAKLAMHFSQKEEDLKEQQKLTRYDLLFKSGCQGEELTQRYEELVQQFSLEKQEMEKSEMLGWFADPEHRARFDRAIDALPNKWKWEIDRLVYEGSPEPKGGENWGKIHRFDDPAILVSAAHQVIQAIMQTAQPMPSA